MPTSTTRLGLLQPTVGDTVAELRLADTNNTHTLDNANLFFSDTLANRGSAVAPLVAGVTYYATDQNLFYEYNGSTWTTLATTLTPVSKTTNYTAVPGDTVNADAQFTVTLPTTPPTGSIVQVYAGAAVNGAAPVTVTRGGSSGGIFGSGLGVAGVTSFLLGANGAFARLIFDGTNWFFIGGQRDTGWVTVSPPAGFAASDLQSDGFLLPALQVRVIGDRAWFSGGYENTSGTTNGFAFTLAAPFVPVNYQQFPATKNNSAGFWLVCVPDGHFALNTSVVNGDTVVLDGGSYRVA